MKQALERNKGGNSSVITKITLRRSNYQRYLRVEEEHEGDRRVNVSTRHVSAHVYHQPNHYSHLKL